MIARAQMYQEMRWCGKTIDLNRPAAKTLGGFDCYGTGKYLDDK